MAFDKTCPGSRTIREPRPEYMTCSKCGREVEIWTDELKATCKCGNKVYRAQQVSCIDWCPHAKECVGPEVYERLRPGATESIDTAASPLDILKRDHERALDTMTLLRGATLCLKLGSLSTQSQVRQRGIDHLNKVLEFFDKDLGIHFRREEEVLFPALEKHLGVEKSPTHLLLKEHEDFWRQVASLKEKLARLTAATDGDRANTGGLEEVSRAIETLLPEHIRRENESLLPLADRLLEPRELEEIAAKLRALK